MMRGRLGDRDRAFPLKRQEAGKPAFQGRPFRIKRDKAFPDRGDLVIVGGRGNVTTMVFRDYRSASQSRISGSSASISANAVSTSPGSGMAGNQPPGLG